MWQQELTLAQTYVDFDVDATVDQKRLNNFAFISKGGFGLVYQAVLTTGIGPPVTVAVKVGHVCLSNLVKPA